MLGGTVRGIQERRYLTEKYQNKQVRIAYATAYAKPHDYDRYGRSKFARKRRFVDILRGNYVEWETPWSKRYALNNSGWDRHEWTREELGRLRDRAWSNCGDRRCCYCWYCNPRRGHWGKKEITRQEHIADLHLKEEIDFYRDLNNKGEGK
jgi:hypothetical protein